MRKGTRELEAPLLKRIRSGGEIKTINSTGWITEIGEALSLLFNTHTGSAAICTEFGMPEFHPDELQNDYRLQLKANEIAALIVRFEPRLKNVRVEGRMEDKNTGRALFEVHGILDHSLSGEKVSYHTVMTGHGRVWLRK